MTHNNRGQTEPYLTSHSQDAPSVWSGAVAPGGYVCATYGNPVESEPCPTHQPMANAHTQLSPEAAAPRAEQALLGACLLDPTHAGELLAELDHDAFTTPGTVAVYTTITSLLESGHVPDPVTVLTDLRRVWGHKIDDRDPAALLGDLMDTCTTPIAAPTWRDLLIEHTARRHITELGDRLVHAAASADTTTLIHTITTATNHLANDAQQLKLSTSRPSPSGQDEQERRAA